MVESSEQSGQRIIDLNLQVGDRVKEVIAGTSVNILEVTKVSKHGTVTMEGA